MNRRWIVTLIVFLAVGLLLPAAPALADDGPPGDGVVIWNEDYTLKEGERLDGDLVVFNGDVEMEEGSRVAGSVIVWNGSADVAGTVEGDLVVSGGRITLDDSARVEGNLVCSWNCDLEREEGARVEGRVTEGIPLPGFRFERWLNMPRVAPRVVSPPSLWDSGLGRVLHWTLRVMRSLAAILVVATVAGLVALIWPHQTTRVGRTVVEAPGPSLGIGLLTMIAAAALVIALAVTICLSPVAALAALALGAAGLFGWAAVGAVVGERLLQALNARQVVPLWAAGLGTLLITLVTAGLGTAFCLAPLGWLMVLILGSMGLGGVVLTRFGTAAYRPGAPLAAVASEPAEPLERAGGGDEA